MPTNLTGNPAVFSTQRAPVSGEPRTSSSVTGPFQDSADRTAFLKDRLEHIDPDKGGVRRRRRFATIAALKASADHPDLTIAQVDGVGCYTYLATSTLAEASPVIITPTDVGGGAGRWVHDVYGTLNIANGVPQLDGSAEVPTARLAATNAANVPTKKILGAHIVNGVVARDFKSVAAVFIVPNDATTRDVTGTMTTFSGLKAGDIIDIDYTANANPQSSPNYLFLSVRVIKPGASNDDGPEHMAPFIPNGLTTDSKRPMPMKRFFTCATDGDYSVVLRVRGTATNTAANVDGVHCKHEVTRP